MISAVTFFVSEVLIHCPGKIWRPPKQQEDTSEIKGPRMTVSKQKFRMAVSKQFPSVSGDQNVRVIRIEREIASSSSEMACGAI